MNNAVSFVPMSPRITSPAHPSSGGGTPRGGGGGGRGRGGHPGDRIMRELIGQTVRIIEGPYKGNI